MISMHIPAAAWSLNIFFQFELLFDLCTAYTSRQPLVIQRSLVFPLFHILDMLHDIGLNHTIFINNHSIV